jgi:hypothetical protein
MMVFIRPTIINDYNDLVKIGVRKFNQVNQGLDMRSERGSSIIPKQLFDENDPTIQTDLFTK